MASTRAFVFRLDGAAPGDHDLFLVIPDRGDAPPLERRLAQVGGGFGFAPAADEVIEVVDDQRRGLDAVIDAAGELTLHLGDPALATDGAARGLELVTPPDGVAVSATVAVITAVWGQRASSLSSSDTFVHLVRACRDVGRAADPHPVGPRTPLHVMFVAGSNNQHFSPLSSLIRTELPDDALGFTLAVSPRDVEAIADTFATRQYDDLLGFDLMYVGFRTQPAYAVRLLEHLHGCRYVPELIRVHDGDYCRPSDGDVLTIACALVLHAGHSDLAHVGDVSARVVAAEAAARILAAHVEPTRVKIAEPPPLSELTAGWLTYVEAGLNAGAGELPQAYEKLLGLAGSTDHQLREHALRAAAQIMPLLSESDVDRVMAADAARMGADPAIAANVARLAEMIAADDDSAPR